MNSVILRGDFRPGLVARAVASVKTWQRNRRAIRELNALPDGLLMDIGIERHQIADAVKHSGSFTGVTRLHGQSSAAGSEIRQAA